MTLRGLAIVWVSLLGLGIAGLPLGESFWLADTSLFEPFSSVVSPAPIMTGKLDEGLSSANNNPSKSEQSVIINSEMAQRQQQQLPPNKCQCDPDLVFNQTAAHLTRWLALNPFPVAASSPASSSSSSGSSPSTAPSKTTSTGHSGSRQSMSRQSVASGSNNSSRWRATSGGNSGHWHLRSASSGGGLSKRQSTGTPTSVSARGPPGPKGEPGAKGEQGVACLVTVRDREAMFDLDANETSDIQQQTQSKQEARLVLVESEQLLALRTKSGWVQVRLAGRPLRDFRKTVAKFALSSPDIRRQLLSSSADGNSIRTGKSSLSSGRGRRRKLTALPNGRRNAIGRQVGLQTNRKRRPSLSEGADTSGAAKEPGNDVESSSSMVGLAIESRKDGRKSDKFESNQDDDGVEEDEEEEDDDDDDEDDGEEEEEEDELDDDDDDDDEDDDGDGDHAHKEESDEKREIAQTDRHLKRPTTNSVGDKFELAKTPKMLEGIGKDDDDDVDDDDDDDDDDDQDIDNDLDDHNQLNADENDYADKNQLTLGTAAKSDVKPTHRKKAQVHARFGLALGGQSSKPLDGTPKEPQMRIRVAALNEPFPGNVHGIRGADFECRRHAAQSNVKGSFKALLAASYQNLNEIVRHTAASLYPVSNIRGEILANSWSDLFKKPARMPNPLSRIYSFDGRHVATNSNWPNKLIWHGASSKMGQRDQLQNCDGWHSDSLAKFGFASPIHAPRFALATSLSVPGQFPAKTATGTLSQSRRLLKRRSIVSPTNNNTANFNIYKNNQHNNATQRDFGFVLETIEKFPCRMPLILLCVETVAQPFEQKYTNKNNIN